eukprot:10274565-Prorocentrum_lima.AAC.1
MCIRDRPSPPAQPAAQLPLGAPAAWAQAPPQQPMQYPGEWICGARYKDNWPWRQACRECWAMRPMVARRGTAVLGGARRPASRPPAAKPPPPV